jgi:hypothetical protein
VQISVINFKISLVTVIFLKFWGIPVGTPAQKCSLGRAFFWKLISAFGGNSEDLTA